MISISRGSSILYHKTTIYNLALIVNSNKFVLSPAVANESEQQFNRKELFYLSLSRSRTGDATIIDSHLSVLLVIDGQKLGSSYTIRPVDYWGEEYRKLGKNEMEDRVFSDKQSIPKALSYIKEVHINVNRELLDMRGKRLLKTLLISLKRRKINVYVYDDKNAAVLLNKRKAIDVRTLNLKVDKETIKQAPFYRHERTYLKPYYELLIWPTKTKMTEKHKRIVEQALFYPYDFNPSFANELHNAKNDKTTKNFKYIAKILSFMKKNKLAKPDDVRKYIAEKWDLR